MDDFDADFFMCNSNLVSLSDSSESQTQQSLPDWISSTEPQPSFNLAELLSDAYGQQHLVLNELSFPTEPSVGTFGLPTQAAVQFGSDATDTFVQELSDGDGQDVVAQDVWPTHRISAIDDTYTTIDMGDIPEVIRNYFSTSEPTPVDENAPQQCHFPGCSEEKVFSTPSALKRHRDKHVRPYICHETLCNRKNFGDKGGLERHKREVHGFQVYTCPVLSCKRSKRGFHRKYNLLEHQKRAHKIGPSIFLRGHSHADERSEEEKTQALGFEDEVDEMIGEMAELKSVANVQENEMGEQSLRSKLRDLQAMRAEIDEDIISLQRVLSIMEGSSP